MEKGNESGLTSSYKSGWQIWFTHLRQIWSRGATLVDKFWTNLEQGEKSGRQIWDKTGAGGTNLEQVDNLGRVSKRCRKLWKLVQFDLRHRAATCAMDNFGVAVVNICRTIVLKMCIAHNHFVDALLYRATLSASFTPTQILVLLSLSVQLVIHS